MDVDVLDNSGSKTVLVNKKLLESKKILSMESDPYDHSSTIIQADEIGNDNIRVEEGKLNSTQILNQENPENEGNFTEIKNTEQPSGKILEKITFSSGVLPSGRRKKLEFDPPTLKKESIDSIRKIYRLISNKTMRELNLKDNRPLRYLISLLLKVKTTLKRRNRRRTRRRL